MKAWRVYMNGKFLGITESNYHWAVGYWVKRARTTGNRYKLVEIALADADGPVFNRDYVFTACAVFT